MSPHKPPKAPTHMHPCLRRMTTAGRAAQLPARQPGQRALCRRCRPRAERTRGGARRRRATQGRRCARTRATQGKP
eukprot:91957-Chlamydomonas_euryale.AAC.1